MSQRADKLTSGQANKQTDQQADESMSQQVNEPTRSELTGARAQRPEFRDKNSEVK